MSITIENPTAEEIIAALKSQISTSEFERLKALLAEHEETPEEEETAWRAASARAAARFFDDEETQ